MADVGCYPLAAPREMTNLAMTTYKPEQRTDVVCLLTSALEPEAVMPKLRLESDGVQQTFCSDGNILYLCHLGHGCPVYSCQARELS